MTSEHAPAEGQGADSGGRHRFLSAVVCARQAPDARLLARVCTARAGAADTGRLAELSITLILADTLSLDDPRAVPQK